MHAFCSRHGEPMATRAKKTITGARASFSIRLPADSGSWLYDLSTETGKSLTDLVLGYVEDARTFWGLVGPVQEALTEDAKKLGLSQRDYVRYLALCRYRLIKTKGIAFDKDDLDHHIVRSE